ncbi:LamB/YcsF family protein [Babesia caballi]|uniref:LamB/YcsF family protein n=1 Tax=Babesia caballi TaxID=5871 RepID=A0AAV4M1V0_BABCB|nr:LamB/YcsF family protein [Babesia caballi]
MRTSSSPALKVSMENDCGRSFETFRLGNRESTNDSIKMRSLEPGAYGLCDPARTFPRASPRAAASCSSRYGTCMRRVKSWTLGCDSRIRAVGGDECPLTSERRPSGTDRLCCKLFVALLFRMRDARTHGLP